MSTPPARRVHSSPAAAAIHASQTPALLRWSGPIGSIGLMVAAVIVFTAAGYGQTLLEANGRGRLWLSGILAIFSAIPAIALATAYALAAIGLGRLPAIALARLAGGASRGGGVWVQVGLGFALMLFLSHALGMAGALPAGIVGQVVAWVFVGVGLVLLADQVVRGELRPEAWPVAPVWIVLGAPAVGLMIVAATSPPGWLWQSEARGFDAISYHLQLAKEWSIDGRLWPLEHSVYSFLPSYVESAYLHLTAMVGGGYRLTEGEGPGLIAAQMLHMQMALLSAVLIGRAVFLALQRAGTARAWARRCGAMAGALFLCTPWVMVTATLAYNEMAVTLFTAAALAVCLGNAPGDDSDGASQRRSALARWIAAGALMGAAASAKPTAMFLAAPTVGLLLLVTTPRREWLRAGAAGAIAGLAVMLPWLLRNWAASGNPVFPFAAGLFGSGHWTAEQVGRYAAAHSVEGGIGARAAMLFDGRRGLMHEQWALFFPLTVAGMVAAAAWVKTRRVGLALAGGAAAQVAFWMFLTHEQSRFLVPLAPALAVGFGLGAGALVAWITRRGAARPIHALAAVVIASGPGSQFAWSTLVFLRQYPDDRGGGTPNIGLLLGVSTFTGEPFVRAMEHLHPRDRLAAAQESAPHSVAFANAVLGIDDKLYLLGDATPLYHRDVVLYHTTWDASPLGEAVRENPEDPAAWTAALRARGVTHVLVNYDELGRYILKDGWYDPAVTIPLVRGWLERHGEPIGAWPGHAGGSVLYRLGGGAGEGLR